MRPSILPSNYSLLKVGWLLKATYKAVKFVKTHRESCGLGRTKQRLYHLSWTIGSSTGQRGKKVVLGAGRKEAFKAQGTLCKPRERVGKMPQQFRDMCYCAEDPS